MKDKFIDLQTRKLMTGSIDRRKFMMSVLATGLTVPAALSLATVSYTHLTLPTILRV